MSAKTSGENYAEITDFAEFFRSEYPRIVREITLMLDDRDAAAQIAQEAFTRLYVHWSKVSRYDKPGAWVRTVAIRLGLRFGHLRFVPLSAIEREPHMDTPFGVVLDVRNALQKLSRMQRAAVILRFYRDLPIGEIADVLGCKEATAKVHLHRAREQLRILLADYGPGA